MPLFSRRAALAAAAIWTLACVPAARAQPGEEVPFVTTPDNVTLEMLRLARVGPADHVIDLGSGDGRIVILAARRFGATGLGVEIVPDLVQRSLRNAQLAGVADRVSFREQDLFATDLSAATVITMYLLPEVNLQLRPALLALRPGTRLVSHDWDMGDWQPDHTSVVPVPDKQLGLEKSSKVHLWVVPARVEGLWCGRWRSRPASLRLTQRYQAVEATLRQGAVTRRAEGRLAGDTLRLHLARGTPTLLRVRGESLVAAGRGPSGAPQGTIVLRRAAGDKCSRVPAAHAG